MTRAELLADDPLWLILIKVVVLLLLGPVMTLFMIIWERKVDRPDAAAARPEPGRPERLPAVARGRAQAAVQGADHPGRRGPEGRTSSRRSSSVIPAILAFSVIPFGPQVSIFGEQTVLQLVDLPVGVLVVLACSSLGVYGIVLAGWASGSPYPLLGGLRSAAQMISYEIAMGLSIVAVVLYAQSLSTGDIVDAQAQRAGTSDLLSRAS